MAQERSQNLCIKELLFFLHRIFEFYVGRHSCVSDYKEEEEEELGFAMVAGLSD